MNAPTAYRFTFSTNRPPGSFFTAVLTNNSSISVRVAPLLVQLEDRDGRVINNFGEIWTVKEGKQAFFDLAPGGDCRVSPQSDAEIKRVRVVAEVSYDAGPIPRLVSNISRKLPLNRLSTSSYEWLYKRGYINGKVSDQIESPWMETPQR
jgi:hypothetical protein